MWKWLQGFRKSPGVSAPKPHPLDPKIRKLLLSLPIVESRPYTSTGDMLAEDMDIDQAVSFLLYRAEWPGFKLRGVMDGDTVQTYHPFARVGERYFNVQRVGESTYEGRNNLYEDAD